MVMGHFIYFLFSIQFNSILLCYISKKNTFSNTLKSSFKHPWNTLETPLKHPLELLRNSHETPVKSLKMSLNSWNFLETPLKHLYITFQTFMRHHFNTFDTSCFKGQIKLLGVGRTLLLELLIAAKTVVCKLLNKTEKVSYILLTCRDFWRVNLASKKVVPS